MLDRTIYLSKIKHLLQNNPIVALIGARQVGKTTLARKIASEFNEVTFFDLENPAHLARLSDPLLALQNLAGLIVIDEIQHQPELFKVLRVLADRPYQPGRFLILGSASPVLLKQSAESLAGRIAYLEISGFWLAETGEKHLDALWLRGGFPRSFLAATEQDSMEWRQNFIRTYLERDLPQLGINIPAIILRRFWIMLCHYHGQLWNAAEFARAFGINEKTVRHYLDILSVTFMVRQLPPWWENIAKRQVKAPKVYLNDTGLLHTLLGLNTREAVESHPKIGASWEGFVLHNVLKQLQAQNEEAYFWRTHAGAELDLLVIHGNARLGFEIKRTVAPTITRAMCVAAEDLQLTHLYAVHAGSESYLLAPQVTALSAYRLIEDLKPLK